MNLLQSLLFLAYMGTTLNYGECVNTGAMAEYYTETNKIIFCEENTYSSVIIHETGHVFWLMAMTSNERDGWKNLNSSCKKSECFISSYSQKNMYEDFAETFMAYGNGQYTLKNKVIKNKILYIKNLIGNYE